MFLANSQSITVDNFVNLTETLQNRVRILTNDKMTLENSIKKTGIELNALKLKQETIERTKYNFILNFIKLIVCKHDIFCLLRFHPKHHYKH